MTVYSDYLAIYLDYKNKQLIRHNFCLLRYFLIHIHVGKNIRRKFAYQITLLTNFE